MAQLQVSVRGATVVDKTSTSCSGVSLKTFAVFSNPGNQSVVDVRLDRDWRPRMFVTSQQYFIIGLIHLYYYYFLPVTPTGGGGRRRGGVSLGGNV